MSIEQQAIQEIVSMAKAGTKPDAETSYPVILVPEKYALKDVERFNALRNRFRGTMSTPFIDDFTRYVNEQKQSTTFINPEEMSAVSLFNMGTEDEPGHCDNKGMLELQKLAAYKALCRIDGNSKTQQDMIDWLEDWRDFLGSVDDEGNDLDIRTATRLVRQIKIDASSMQEHNHGNLSQSTSAMASVEAKSKEGKLPSAFRMTCIPYEGLNSRSFDMMLSMSTAHGDTPRLTLRVARFEAEKEAMATELRTKLEKAIGNADKMYVGSFSSNK